MTLRFKLIKSNLLTTKKAYHAVPVSRKTINEDDLIESIIRPGSGITKGEALSMIEAYHEAICQALEEGDIVSTEMYTIKPSIGGSFDDYNSPFDSKKHSVKMNITSGKRLNKVTTRIKPRRKTGESLMPVIKRFLDIKNKSLDGPVAVGSLLVIRGNRLKFDPDDDRQGVYLQMDGSAKVIKADIVAENTNARLLLQVPEMQPGQYRVLVKTVYRNSKMLRTAFSKDKIQVM
ncbi:MAG: DUF4469 domain-containing protein [Bacteroidales bacterium]|nr:DUF4469 domain-containing protein [Bacteroidales bacterium]